MPQRDPWWWPAVGVAWGFAIWLFTICAWLAVMAAMYGIYVLFGGKGMLAFAAVALGILIHFQIKDIEEGMTGGPLQNLLARWLRYRENRRNNR